MRGVKKLSSAAASLSVLAVCLFVVLNFRSIDDWLKLRNYSPPPEVAKIAEEDTMTGEAEHIFYVNHPDLIKSADSFRQECPTYEQTIVLGCYHSDQRGIFVYDVNDPRLNGVVEVTSAHEMLHGAYERLSRSDKKQVNAWLNDFYANGLHDKRIIDTINAYKKTEPNAVVDEMHSVFGTEVSNLPSQLENYYSRYFSKRSAVTTFADGYEAEFTKRLDQIDNMEQQLKVLKQQISNEENNLNAMLISIETDRRRLDALRSGGQIAEYNAAIAGFNSEVDQYNSGIANARADIARYNLLVQSHNQLASELRSLYSSLDSSLSPQTTQ